VIIGLDWIGFNLIQFDSLKQNEFILSNGIKSNQRVCKDFDFWEIVHFEKFQ
jgi:hypothetical protein